MICPTLLFGLTLCITDASLVEQLQLYYDYKFSINVSKITTVSTVLQCIRECLTPHTPTSATYHGNNCWCHSNVFSSKEGSHIVAGAVYVRPPLTNSDDTNSNCPEEYYHNDTFSLCFKFFRDSVSHLEAEQLCQEQSASLTKIDSEEKQQHIMQYFAMGVTDLVHLQGSLNNMSDWQYYDNTVMSFTNWKEGEPSIGGDKVFMVMDLGKNGSWSSVNNEFPASYICEKYF